MPKAKKDKIIGQERKNKVIAYKNCCEKKDYKIVDFHFGSAHRVAHIQLRLSKYG